MNGATFTEAGFDGNKAAQLFAKGDLLDSLSPKKIGIAGIAQVGPRGVVVLLMLLQAKGASASQPLPNHGV